MDKQLREKYGDPEEQGGQENMFNQKRDIEPKIGGLSIANASPQTKLIYTAIVAAIVGGVFYFGKILRGNTVIISLADNKWEICSESKMLLN